MRKDYRKYLTLLDRFPYILVAVIIGLSFIFFFLIRNNLPLEFFSGSTTIVEDETEYSVFITSPINDKVYNFINLKETIPIEIKSKQAETEGFKIIVMVNENEIKTFNSPPYEYNWNPSISGEYEIVARLVDDNNSVLSESGKVTFVVEYEMENPKPLLSVQTLKKKKNRYLQILILDLKIPYPSGFLFSPINVTHLL